MSGYLFAHASDEMLAQTEEEAANAMDQAGDGDAVGHCFPTLMHTWFRDARYEIVEQVLPPERCLHVSIEDVYSILRHTKTSWFALRPYWMSGKTASSSYRQIFTAIQMKAMPRS